MYSREYQGRALNFEASGGLLNASLVMQDKETDTYWSIIEGKAIAGEKELGVKTEEALKAAILEFKPGFSG